ncbi:MAG: sterol desaturase family protein, partial [archaeon]|nr:sterol desaturase family protein [archaeon]
QTRPGFFKTAAEADALFLTLLAAATHTGVYLCATGFFLLCDRLKLLQGHKLPRTGRLLPSARLLAATLRDAAVGQLAVQPAASYLLLFALGLAPDRFSPLPGPEAVYLHLAGALLFNEASFYLLHRAMHEVPLLYRAVHKQHHQYVGTVALAAEHAHPVEQLLCNDLPVVGYCIAARVHPLIFCVYLAWRLQETCETHSGYCFQRTLLGRLGLLNGRQAEFHDFHHTVNSGNYGHHLIDELFRSMDLWLSLTQARIVPHSSQRKLSQKMAPSQQDSAPIYLRDPSRQSHLHLHYSCLQN